MKGAGVKNILYNFNINEVFYWIAHSFIYLPSSDNKSWKEKRFCLWHFPLDVLSLDTEFSQYLWIYRPKAISLMKVERSPILIQIAVDPGLCTLLIRAPWGGRKD